MSGRRATMVAILSLILAACSAGAQPAATTRASPHPSLDPLPLATPSPAVVVVTPTPAPTPDPTPKPTPVPVPPKPTGVKFHEDIDCLKNDCNRARITQTVTWKAPRTKGVEIRVYGVTECLAEPAHPEPGASGPCLVKNTLLPKSVRTLLATAPASDRWVSWSWKQWTGCDTRPFGSNPDGPGYFAVVVAAYNASGHSIFAIAAPGSWSEPGPGEMPC